MSAISTAIRRLVGPEALADDRPFQAIWNGKVIASSDRTVVVVVEGNHYFPPESVDHALLEPSDRAPTWMCR
jgi:uncharacterized protein (DUF427 family)